MTDDPYAGMPPHLAAIARKNLRAVDRVTSAFNARAATVPTPAPTVAAPAKTPATVPASFNLPIGGPVDVAIGGPLPPVVTAASRATQPQTVAPTAPALSRTPPPMGTSGRYIQHPDAYNQTLSVVTPRSVAQFMQQPVTAKPIPPAERLRKQFGWGD